MTDPHNRCQIADIDDELLAALQTEGWQVRPANPDEPRYANPDWFMFLRTPDGTLLRATRPTGNRQR